MEVRRGRQFFHRVRKVLTSILVFAAGITQLHAQQLPRHALLVGCTQYDNLDESFQLKGGVNDVQLVRRLLIDRFRFDSERDDIVTLAAGQGEDRQPTRANIERELRRLGQTVGPGEYVVILLAGHGSQQPDDDPGNPGDIETDGLDEIFLPCDVEGFDGETGTVTNAIVDDEFRQWLSAIVSRKAFVWLIMDTCHSGSGIRGATAEISRHVPPARLIPEAAMAAAGNQHRDQAATEPLFDGPGGLVAVYASQPHEWAPEKKLPMGADPDLRKYHGLLTYTICEILAGTDRALTYNELVQAVQTRYITMGRRGPTPLIEGSHRDRLVLGSESYPDRSRILLQRSKLRPENMTVNAGAIHGLTEGSILAVYPPVGTKSEGPDGLLGHVLVTRVDITEADVEPCAFAAMPPPDQTVVPNRSRCEVVFHQLDSDRFRVAVDPLDSDGESLAPAIRDKLVSELSSQASQLVTLVDRTSEADWLVRYARGDVQLVPAEGISSRDQAGYRESIAPVPVSDRWAERVMNDLQRIARARGLLRITQLASRSSRQPNLGFSMKATDAENQPIAWQSQGLTVHDGQHVQVHLSNTGSDSIDVTLLYVDSAYGITCLYPEVGEINRIAASEQRSVGLTITATTTGIEHVVAIALKAERQPVDFSILAQPSLKVASVRGHSNRWLESPLGQLCRTAIYGSGSTRGVRRDQSQDYDIQVLTWRVER